MDNFGQCNQSRDREVRQKILRRLTEKNNWLWQSMKTDSMVVRFGVFDPLNTNDYILGTAYVHPLPCHLLNKCGICRGVGLQRKIRKDDIKGGGGQ
jgi:hypothetical protein